MLAEPVVDDVDVTRDLQAGVLTVAMLMPSKKWTWSGTPPAASSLGTSVCSRLSSAET
jgi:hypothetical protein